MWVRHVLVGLRVCSALHPTWSSCFPSVIVKSSEYVVMSSELELCLQVRFLPVLYAASHRNLVVIPSRPPQASILHPASRDKLEHSATLTVIFATQHELRQCRS